MRSLGEADPKRVLVVMPNWVGDVTMATAALGCLRRAFPVARITVLVRSWLREVLEGSPRLDELVLYDHRGEHAGLRGYLRMARSLRPRGLRHERLDRAGVLPHSFRAALTARLSGARRRIGYSRGDRGWLLTDSMRPPREAGHWMPVPKTLYYLDLLKAAGLDTEGARPELFCTPEDQQRARDLLDRAGIGPDDPLALINPGANFGSSKCWLPERFAEVADGLAERHGARVGLVCGPGEEPIVERILAHAGTGPVNFAEKRLPLSVLKALVDCCDLMVTNDTGPRHFAVAFDKPAVVIMGSTDPRHTAANLGKTIVVRKDVPCGPCHERTCPTDHVCMTSVTAGDVLDAAARLVETHWGAQKD